MLKAAGGLVFRPHISYVILWLKFLMKMDVFGSPQLGILSSCSPFAFSVLHTLTHACKYFGTVNFQILFWIRKLSLNFLHQHSSGVEPDKDEGSRRRSSRKRESNMNYSTHMNGQPLSKNDISYIRRSHVWNQVSCLTNLFALAVFPR